MKQSLTYIAVALMVLLTSCEAIAGIFKAGMGFGIFLVILVIGIIGFVIFKARKK
jgi:hypothetical protein